MVRTVDVDDLTHFGVDVLSSLGVPAADAQLLADSLVAAELWGHSSHGMLRLPWYVQRLRSGAMTPSPERDRGRLRGRWWCSTVSTASGRC